MKTNKILRKIKRVVAFFILLLILSRVTAFPLQTELSFLVNHLDANEGMLYQWISEVSKAITDLNNNYPFLSYGTDWLAFGYSNSNRSNFPSSFRVSNR